jgi:hypothetical protein
MAKHSEAFEAGVQRLASALDAAAVVSFDREWSPPAVTPEALSDAGDKSTSKGKSKAKAKTSTAPPASVTADAWVEAKLDAKWPVAVLVACRDYKQKVKAPQVVSLAAEAAAVGASAAVMFATSTYSDNALAAGRDGGVACGRLFAKKAPQLPAELALVCRACEASMQIAPASPVQIPGVHTWGDLLNTTVTADGRSGLLLDDVVAQFLNGFRAAVEQQRKRGGWPPTWIVRHNYGGPAGGIHLNVAGYWKAHRGVLRAELKGGRYVLAGHAGQGGAKAPPSDATWSPINPAINPLPPHAPVAYVSPGDLRATLLRTIGDQPLPTGALRSSG